MNDFITWNYYSKTQVNKNKHISNIDNIFPNKPNLIRYVILKVLNIQKDIGHVFPLFRLLNDCNMWYSPTFGDFDKILNCTKLYQCTFVH